MTYLKQKFPKLSTESYKNMIRNFNLPDCENFDNVNQYIQIVYPELSDQNARKHLMILSKIIQN